MTRGAQTRSSVGRVQSAAVGRPVRSGAVVPSDDCSIATRSLNLGAEGAFALIRETLALGRELWLEASGESMYPVVRSGSRVLLTPRRRPLRRGDIVLVRRGDRLILHRVRHLRNDRVVTQGDACPEADPAVPNSNAIGLAMACDDGRGIRPLALGAPWYGVSAAGRALWVVAHRFIRGWRK
jgi:hypothetical protein